MKHLISEGTWIPVPLPPEKRFAYEAAWKVIFDILEELEARDARTNLGCSDPIPESDEPAAEEICGSVDGEPAQ